MATSTRGGFPFDLMARSALQLESVTVLRVSVFADSLRRESLMLNMALSFTFCPVSTGTAPRSLSLKFPTASAIPIPMRLLLLLLRLSTVLHRLSSPNSASYPLKTRTRPLSSGSATITSSVPFWTLTTMFHHDGYRTYRVWYQSYI